MATTVARLVEEASMPVTIPPLLATPPPPSKVKVERHVPMTPPLHVKVLIPLTPIEIKDEDSESEAATAVEKQKGDSEMAPQATEAEKQENDLEMTPQTVPSPRAVPLPPWHHPGIPAPAPTVPTPPAPLTPSPLTLHPRGGMRTRGITSGGMTTRGITRGMTTLLGPRGSGSRGGEARTRSGTPSATALGVRALIW